MAAVTSRYARAFADVVFDKKLDGSATVQQLRDIVSLVQENPDLKRIWENPAVPAEQKRNLLDAIVTRLGTVRQLRNFIAVLIDHRRIIALPQIAQQFEVELNQRLGRIDVEIASARTLTSVEVEAVKAQIARITGKVVTARNTVVPELIGGAMVKLGSTVYDGSIKGQLQKIKEQLSAE